ncbi:LLM class flavin-dependent oxidoreductase [Tahibacter amnicola]|uniref:LLM class flavin-dependent oxidoreductase n=1 Tax=Tahibacter amnicola TaxID=2976241 RepID=A0ABY6B752_9GAMM|nr:LLM class flavin-dependent oxidoreductase [Tahibacter amnicola]UXI65933.1 LLM class flavin-dependent oxidoreductase [Tahibacter amnicola]
MQFGTFSPFQIPRPWDEGSETTAYQNALAHVELCDRLGFSHAWAMEHHFLEEYSHSSAPEIFLAACSQITRKIRLGHGVVLMPSGYNHPARVAERLGVLDVISNGRVEWGTGEGSSAMELDGFSIPLASKRTHWEEGVTECARMMTMNPYPGFEGTSFSMPCRNIVPKPVQKPHPPLWLACSNRESIKRAARLGMGAMTFAFVDPEDAKEWVDDYYRIIKEECVPIGATVNANIMMVTGLSVHNDAAEAVRRGGDGFNFFNYALHHYYAFGSYKPGRTDLWKEYESARGKIPPAGAERGIGTPGELRKYLRKFESAGVDQIAFIPQCGRVTHEHVCESLMLFASAVMPEFRDRHEARASRKAEELAPFIAAALERKQRIDPVKDEEIPEVAALGRRIVDQGRASKMAQS